MTTPNFVGSGRIDRRTRLYLTRTLRRVWNLMRDEKARTLRQIAELVGCSEQMAFLRLMDLRTPFWAARFPALEVTELSNGRYRVLVPDAYKARKKA